MPISVFRKSCIFWVMAVLFLVPLAKTKEMAMVKCFEEACLFDIKNFVYIKELMLEKIDKSEVSKLFFKNHLDELIGNRYDTVVVNQTENFHYVNLDNKDPIDIVYEGNPGMESMATIYILQNKNKKTITQLFYNKIAALTYDSVQALNGCISKPAYCCGADAGEVSYFQLDSNQFKETSFIKIFYTLKYPEYRFISSVDVITSNDTYLRSSPELINRPDSSDMDRYGVIIGNALLQIPKNSPVTILSEKKNDSGKKWTFIKSNCFDLSRYNLVVNWGRKGGQCAGWIESESLVQNQ